MTDIDDDWDGDGFDRYGEPDYDDEPGDDEYKDDLAMGYINPDGSQRDPDPPDGYDPWDYRPSRRDRLRRVFRTLMPRRRVAIGREQYDDGPPF